MRQLGGQARPLIIRWARRLVIAFFAVWALYLIAANVLLRTSLLTRFTNARAPKLLVAYREAWSPWPGKVYVRDLTLRGQSSSMEWAFRFDEASFTVDLVALASKRFEASGIDARGLDVRFRRRFGTEQQAKDHHADLYPPIAGYADPPLRDIGAKKPPDPDKKSWGVVLDGFHVEGVGQIWIDEYRWSGAGRTDGRFHYLPDERIVIGPASIDLDGGGLFLGHDALVTELRGHLAATVDPFDPREMTDQHPLAVFAKIDGVVEVVGEVHDGKALGRYLPDGGAIHELRASSVVGVGLVRGKLVPGSSVVITTERFVGEKPPWTVATRGLTRAWVEQDGMLRAVHAQEATSITREGHEKNPIRAGLVRLAARTRETDLTKPFGDLALELEVPELRVPALDVLTKDMPRPDGLTLSGGAVTADIHADFAAGPMILKSEIGLAGKGIRVDYAKTTLVSDMTAKLAADDIAFVRGDGKIRKSTIAIRNLRARGETEVDQWDGDVTIEGGEIRLRDRPGVTMKMGAMMEDGRPILAMLVGKKLVPQIVSGLFPLEKSTARLELTIGKDETMIRGLRSHAEEIDVHGTWVKRKKSKNGAFLFKGKLLSFGLEFGGNGTKVHVTDPEAWFVRREREILADPRPNR